MGVGQYISDTFSSIFFKSVLRHLANIKRPYYQRSLYLLFACQSLPEPPSNSGQRQELKDLFCIVEKAISLGIKEDNKEKCKEMFDHANSVLEKYATKYDSWFSIDTMIKNQPHLPISFDIACRDDLEAQKLFREVNKKVEEKIKSMQDAKRQQVDIKVWADEPTTYLKEEFKYNAIKCSVEIEETATLAILLHRFLEYQVLQQPEKKYMLHLDKFPYFYNASPVSLTPFKSEDGSRRRIPCICPYKSVKSYRQQSRSTILSLHVITDREFTSITVRVGNTKPVELPSELYRNAWPAEDQKTVVVRQRSLSFSLATLDTIPMTMPVPSPHQEPYNTSLVYLNHSNTTFVQAGGHDNAAALHSSTLTSTTTLNGGPSSTSNIVDPVPLQMPRPQVAQNTLPPTNQITVVNNIQMPTPALYQPVPSPASNHTSKKPADVSAVPVKEPAIVSMEPQLLSTYSGNVGFDPTLGNIVDMNLATGEKKKKTGFRAWMRNTLGSIAGK